MAPVRMKKDRVRHNGDTTTIAELADRGLITFRKCERFHNRKGAVYFADTALGEGWEISKYAYESRTKGVETP